MIKYDDPNAPKSLKEAKATCPLCKKGKYDPKKYKVCFMCTEKIVTENRNRDYFAGKALQGLLAQIKPGKSFSTETLAHNAYAVAEAMVAMKRQVEQARLGKLVAAMAPPPKDA